VNLHPNEGAEPARLRPTESGWTYVDTITDGANTADRWFRGRVRVLSSVEWQPVPRGWVHHLSVSLEDEPGPPSTEVIDRACRVFAMPPIYDRRIWHSPRVVHLYAQAS
jgi:hypothetical protein